MTGVWNPGLPSALSLVLATIQSASVAATVTQNAGVVVGNSVLLRGRLVFTAAGVAANRISLNLTLSGATLPSTYLGLPIGVFVYTVLGSGVQHSGVVVMNTLNQLQFIVSGATNGLGINPAVTIAIGDQLVFTATLPLI